VLNGIAQPGEAVGGVRGEGPATTDGPIGRGAVKRLGIVARRAPLTAGLVVVLWSVGAVTGSLLDGPPAVLRAAVGVGVRPLAAGRWWSPLTSALWCSGLLSYLLTTIALVALLPLVERRLGILRAALTLVMGQVLGVLGGIGVVLALGTGGGRWTTQLHQMLALGPGVGLVAAVLMVSAGLGAMWRRRVRLVLLTGLVMLALYSGLLGDLLRLAGGVIGLVVGMCTTGRRRHQVRPGRPSVPETRVLVALVVVASAVGPLLAAVAQSRVGPLSVSRLLFASPPPDPAVVAQLCANPAAASECSSLRERLQLSGIGSGLMSVLPIVLMLITAEGLRRGRRVAWIAALIGNLVLGALGLALARHTSTATMKQRVLLGEGVHVHPWLVLAVAALAPLLTAVLLAVTRRRFGLRAPAGTYRGAARVMAGTLLVVCVVYLVGSVVIGAGYDPRPGLGALLIDLPARFIPPGYLGEFEPAFFPVSTPAFWLYEWTGPVFWTVVAVVVLRAFARSRSRDTGPDLARIRALLTTWGGGSLSHMATWVGQRYWFTPDGTAAIAYRVIGGVAITTGDPIGDRDARQFAVLGFVGHCHEHAWSPCLYSVSDEVELMARAMGWSTVQVAEETVVPLADLAFTGKKWQDVRTALNKAERAGIGIEDTTLARAPLVITDQIRAIAEEWAADKGLPEMGFTLGGLAELEDPDVRLILAVDSDRTVHGVTSWLPVRRDGEIVGWTLDFMRRRSDGFNGVMEFLIASTATICQNEGAEFLSLSGAPLARLDHDQPIGGLQKLLDTLSRRLEPVYGFASLLAFKAKFQPEYRPLYLAYPDPIALPAIGNALGRAYLPHLSARQLTRLARAVLR